jgi:archaellum component FlaD/FlaE
VLLFDSVTIPAIVIDIETSGGPHGYRKHGTGFDARADEHTRSDAGACNARAQEGEESQEDRKEGSEEVSQESDEEGSQEVREKSGEEGFEESQEGCEENCKESGQEEKEDEEVKALSPGRSGKTKASGRTLGGFL